MVSHTHDRVTEEAHIGRALSRCGYPEGSIRKLKLQLDVKTQKKKKKHRLVQDHKTSLIIPYVEGVSEAVARVYNRYGVSTAKRTHTTIRNLLVHPKDKVIT